MDTVLPAGPNWRDLIELRNVVNFDIQVNLRRILAGVTNFLPRFGKGTVPFSLWENRGSPPVIPGLILRRRSQVAKAADCKSAIPGSNPGGASGSQAPGSFGVRGLRLS